MMKLIDTKSRICITNTPLRPLISFSMANLAEIKSDSSILDPFAGSCSIPLAAASIEPTCKTVGIEISNAVRFENIIKDFELRNLNLPSALIRGDASDTLIREKARKAIDGNAFDAIITDPPYGLRERIDIHTDSPIVSMMKWIKEDRENGKRLIKNGGKLVAFCPNLEKENFEDLIVGMPNEQLLDEAGMKLISQMKQPLNEALCRWLVVFECIR